MVVAHRHPIAFVLLEDESTPPTTATTLAATGVEDGDDNSSSAKCSISPKLVSINPSSIPPGSIVDYLGNSLAVLDDGSVGRSLPKASATADAVVSKNGVDDLDNGIGGIDMDGISLMVSDDVSSSGSSSSRPIFVPIPKISDIGLIDSPLVSGITAIDALTPIGKGQNMLVIGNADDDDNNDKSSTTNKRGWMINFLRNVIENSRDSSSSGEEGKDTTMMRCYYGLTAGDNTVRSNLLNRLKEAGIQDDVVTVLSTRNYNVKGEEDGGCGGSESLSTEKAMSAAEAVAVAATACSLGEHHALTTGGDSLVFIDDINLHKSLWDVTTQFLVQVYGVDAVVEADLQGGSSSEMRGYFSGLIQRAARFNVKKGGGSVTLILLSTLPGDEDQDANTSGGEEEEPTFEASDFDNMSEKIKTRISMLVKAKVPLTPTNLKKIQIPLPQTSDAENAKRLALQHVEDLISMSDGQIWLDDALAKSGRSPPLDPSRSITRVGVGADTVSCRADAPALRSVVGSLRFEFQQAMDVMESKSTTATTGGAAIVGNKKQVQRRDAFLLAMHQESNEMRKLSHECTALLAASRGHLDAVLAKGGLAGTAEGRQAIDGLIDFVEQNASGVVTEIDSTLDMSVEGRSTLEDAITSYFAGDK
jgi:F0F1-type ATP synthase alpha subunit